MEASPLTQQLRPETFQPKIVQLYRHLLKEDEEVENAEGFWQEFFLLKPDLASLKQLLDEMTVDDLLNVQGRTQQLIRHAIERIKVGVAPANELALDTLAVFLGSVLSKRYTNPSSDTISVLAGIHDADTALSEFVSAIDTTIRSGRNILVRQKAVRAALAMTSGAYATGLITYFTHKDLFPALMKFVQDAESNVQNREPFILLGLLANYNKFEFQNPYRLRLEDFVNENTIRRIVLCVGSTCILARDKYVAIQEDLPEGWSLGGTLAWMGLAAFGQGSTSKPTAPAIAPEEAKTRFMALPGPEAALLLSTFDFANANKLFCFNLVTSSAEQDTGVSPMSGFLSLTSYLFQHAHRSTRASSYAYINMFIIQLLIEDQGLAKRMCSDESKTGVRLCRQRQPYLPLIRGERTLAASIIDIMVDGINHNLRRRLDVEFYILCLGILLRMISFLGRSRIRLAYHWSELWRSLLSFTRFLTSYVGDVKQLPRATEMITLLLNVLALSLSTGESFLPDTSSYDDLFYKLVETGDVLTKFRDAYSLAAQTNTDSIVVLINVSKHYHSMIEGAGSGRPQRKSLSPREVHKIIQQGYETLSIQAKEDLDQWERFREANHKAILKRTARIAIEDSKSLILSVVA